MNNNSIQLYRTVLDTLFDQKGTFIYDNKSHNIRFGADYSLNAKSSIGVLLNGTFADPGRHQHQPHPISYIPTGVVDRVLVADNKST